MLSVNVLGSEKADATADAVKPGRPPRVRVFTDLQVTEGRRHSRLLFLNLHFNWG